MRKAEQGQSQSMLTVVDADGAPAKKQRIQYRVCRTGHRYKYRKVDTNRDSRSTLSVLLTKPNKPNQAGYPEVASAASHGSLGSACGERAQVTQVTQRFNID